MLGAVTDYFTSNSGQVSDGRPRTTYRKKYILQPNEGEDSNQDGEIELDLCYITDRIIVMGSPYADDSSRLNDVRELFEKNHPGHLKIFDLASDEDCMEQDFQNVENFQFLACNPCALTVIIKFCSIVQSYLDVNPLNVIAVHCKTGKGKSCMLIACYLLHSGIFSNSPDAIAFLCRERTPVLLNAISVPSQIRYVHYYETLLRVEHSTCYTYEVDNIRMNTIPSYNSSIVYSGCTPYISISCLATKKSPSFSDDEGILWYPKRVYNQLDYTKKRKLQRYDTDTDSKVDFTFNEDEVQVRGDVVVTVFSAGTGSEEKMFQLYFNTSFVEQNYLKFDKSTIDIANADKLDYTFASDFSVEIFLHKVEAEESINSIDDFYLQEANSKEIKHMYSGGDTVIEESDEEVEVRALPEEEGSIVSTAI